MRCVQVLIVAVCAASPPIICAREHVPRAATTFDWVSESQVEKPLALAGRGQSEAISVGPFSSTKLTDKDTILLAGFANNTADKVFDGTFEQALRTALEESPYLSVLADADVAAGLREMVRPADTPLTAETVRELCQRLNGKAYAQGSISSEAQGFAIGLEAFDCASGQTLAHTRSTTQAKSKILDALGVAVSQLRLQLGESRASVEKFTTPLPLATTPSLEALQAWSTGIKAQQQDGNAAALPFFETAIRADPNFSGALFSLTIYYRNSGQEARAREFLTKAFASRERASKRARLRTAGLYYSFVTVEYDKAVGTLREWMKAYPRDVKAVSDLGSFYGDVCEYERAIAQFREAQRMSPRNVIILGNLIEMLTATGQFGEAKEVYLEMIRRKLDDDTPHVLMYSVAALEHDATATAEQAAWFAGKPQLQHELLSEEADAEAYAGHLARARGLTKQAVDAALRANNNEQAAVWQLNSAWREELFGNSGAVHGLAIDALSKAPASREGDAVAAILLARTGDVTKASALADDLERRYPLHTIVHSYWLPCIRAQIALAGKRPAEALKELESARRYDTLYPQVHYYSHMPSVVLRAEAYLALGQPAAAVKEWEKVLQHRGIVQLSATAPTAKLQLARALSLQAGTENSSAGAKARIAYQEFLSLWNDADSDIPILTEAKAEFAKLK